MDFLKIGVVLHKYITCNIEKSIISNLKEVFNKDIVLPYFLEKTSSSFWCKVM